MKNKLFITATVFALGLGFTVSAQEPDVYVRMANETGAIITSDTDMKVKVVAADYDENGRLINADTELVDIYAGDNAYAYETAINGNREIFLWKGEESSIEPVCAIPLSHPEEEAAYSQAYINAAKNGLLEGLGNAKLDESITKKQIKTVITNAMGDFVIDTNESFDSDETVKGGKVYETIAKVFDFDWYTVNYLSGRKEYVGKADTAVLDVFEDKESVADYADYAACVVGNGGFDGFDGKLKGDEEISVGEFLYLMDEVIGTYIDEPGEYTSSDFDAEKSVIIRSGGVVIDTLITDRNLIVAYSADTRGVVVKDSVVNGVTSIMGCADPENRKFCIALYGEYYDVRVNSAWITLSASGAKMEYYRGTKNSTVNMGMF